MKKFSLQALLTLFVLVIFSSYTNDKSRFSEYENLVPVAIIGSGSAGLGASFVTSSKSFHTVVFQGDSDLGNLNYDRPVKNWLGAPLTPGKEIMARVKEQATHTGAYLTLDPIVTVDFATYPYILQTRSNKKIYALSVVIATGSKPKSLPINGASTYWMKGVIEKINKKESSFKNKRIVIIGSGEDAVTKALTVAETSQEVTILVKGDSLSAPKSKLDELKKFGDKVHVMFSTQVKNIVGDGEKVTGVEIMLDNVMHLIVCDFVVSAIGKTGNSDLFADYLSCSENGYIIVAPHSQRTTLPGIFAAGDVTEHSYGQALIAASDGMKAGYDACTYLKSIDFTSELQKSLDLSLYYPPLTPTIITP
jgi:thioredoxin reductase (NADPH)